MKRFIFLFALSLTSCKKFINWGKVTFNQGCNLGCKLNFCIPKDHIRSVRVYDQFNTISIIDAIWLSQAVKSAYVDLYSGKNSLCVQEKEAMLATELNLIKDKIAFYILIWQQPKCGELLDKENSYWNIVLNTNTGTYAPNIIKLVDLPCEYSLFFGKRKNPFQRVFYVEFDNIGISVNQMTLCFTALNKKTFLKWDIIDSKLVSLNVDYCTDPNYCDTCSKIKLKRCVYEN